MTDNMKVILMALIGVGNVLLIDPLTVPAVSCKVERTLVCLRSCTNPHPPYEKTDYAKHLMYVIIFYGVSKSHCCPKDAFELQETCRASISL